jgi:hypothetical protein
MARLWFRDTLSLLIIQESKMETASNAERITLNAGRGARPRLALATDAKAHFHAHMIATWFRVAAGNPNGCVIKFL